MTNKLSLYLLRIVVRAAAVALLCLLAAPAASAQNRHMPVRPVNRTDTIADAPDSVTVRLGEAELFVDTVAAIPDSLMFGPEESPYDQWTPRKSDFNPDPNRAVWMSALFPGLGQLYNRRYWKLPIIIGGYMGLAYATSWNNGMLNDYTKGYRDIMDNDPNTKSYMDFFPPNIKETDLDKSWLTNVLKSRKDYYRRNRDLCIIAMVGVYLVAMVDAYVDASLSHFDITPELSMDWSPAIFAPGSATKTGIGLCWALNF